MANPTPSQRFINQIKTIIINSLYEDDQLADFFVLKGGTLLELIWGVTKRPSIDIDFSLTVDNRSVISEQNIAQRIEDVLKKGFEQGLESERYYLFDYKFKEKPKVQDQKYASFWGGYEIEFKLSSTAIDKESNLEDCRRRALAVGKKGSTVFKIDLSLFEYCEQALETDFESVYIYIYSPAMVIFEKLRAICQQDIHYPELIGRNPKYRTPRPKDFYDIMILMTKKGITDNDLCSEDNLRLLKTIFSKKQVPLDFLITIDFDYHYGNFEQLKLTLPEEERAINYKELKTYIKGLTRSISKALNQ